ncbi:hypothetical protein [Leptospira licerasiae]|uniref:hypothetical protein n=1 Tax=Leptospira licerasiae TaxID=447106 RepID=UPI00301AB666
MELRNNLGIQILYLANASREIKKAFRFLVEDYGFSVSRPVKSSFGRKVIYTKGKLKIILHYNFRDEFFYFYIVTNDVKINELYSKESEPFVKTFNDLAIKYNVNIKLKDLQPDKKQYLDSLQRNADLLKNYGEKILNMEEWF